MFRFLISEFSRENLKTTLILVIWFNSSVGIALLSSKFVCKNFLLVRTDFSYEMFRFLISDLS